MGRKALGAVAAVAIIMGAAGIYVLGINSSNSDGAQSIPPTCSLTAEPMSGNSPLLVTFSISAEDSDGSIASWELDIDNDGVVEYYGPGDPPSSKQHLYETPATYTADFLVTDDEGSTSSDTVTISVLDNNEPPSGTTTVYFIDVGQGDAILIQTSDSKNILIDAGEDSASSTVVNFLTDKSVTTIDVFVADHPDADNIGGADEVIDSFDVLSIYHPGLEKTTTAYLNFISAAEAEGCPVYTDEEHDPGDYMNWSSEVTFRMLNIDADAEESNDASIVLKMNYGSVDFLFTGDIGFDIEDQMMASFNLDIEILKVSHHGSAYATSDDFLGHATPEVGVISVGDNPYGHPTEETLDRLESHGVTVYRTDYNGTVTVTTDGSDWEVHPQYSPDINNAPEADFSYSIADLTVQFTDQSTDPEDDSLTYSWEFGDGEISTLKNPSHAYPGYGMYTVNLTVSDGELEDRISKAISLNPSGHVVINEIEQNPAGADYGNEWLELYNPTGSVVDLSGWEMRSTAGMVETYVFPDGTTIDAGGYLVINFGAQFLDNEEESVILLDASDVEVDRTPFRTDTYNDSRSWQRVPNGSDTESDSDWAFREETLGFSNE